MPLSDFDCSDFEALGICHPVYRKGQGPGVLIMHEVPGITRQVADFARFVADAGYTVLLPSMFGTPGRGYGPANLLGQMMRACVSREFRLLARRGSSPITDWLRALGRKLHNELGGPGIGALGMCLTGNFALALMADATVLAPVLSQPSLPVGWTSGAKRALHLSEQGLADLKQRCGEGARVLGLRFSHDWMCPAERFERLHEELGDGFEAIELDSGPGNPWGIPRTAHSVLTKDLVDTHGHPTQQARARVLEFFAEQLRI